MDGKAGRCEMFVGKWEGKFEKAQWPNKPISS